MYIRPLIRIQNALFGKKVSVGRAKVAVAHFPSCREEIAAKLPGPTQISLAGKFPSFVFGFLEDVLVSAKYKQLLFHCYYSKPISFDSVKVYQLRSVSNSAFRIISYPRLVVA